MSTQADEVVVVLCDNLTFGAKIACHARTEVDIVSDDQLLKQQLLDRL